MVSRKEYLDPNPPKVTERGHGGAGGVAGCRNRLKAFGSHEQMDGMGCDWEWQWAKGEGEIRAVPRHSTRQGKWGCVVRRMEDRRAWHFLVERVG